MKKLFLSLGITLMCFFPLLAQESSDSEESTLKAEAGSRNLEVQFAPLGGNPISIGGIRYRAFLTNEMAYRANIFLGYTSGSTVTQQEANGVPELRNRNSTLTINIRPGIEMHFSGTKRLSPYVGAELDLAYQSNTTVNEIQNPADPADNAVYELTTKNNNGFFRLGLNGVAGADYYFSNKIYMGTEIGFGLSYQSNSTIKNESTLPGATNTEAKQGSTFSIGPNAVGQIRLGYMF